MLSLAPQKRRMGSAKMRMKRMINKDAISVSVIPVPIALFAFSVSFLPWQILKYAAHPSPKHQAKAWVTMSIGNTAPVAAFPKYPKDELPTKI